MKILWVKAGKLLPVDTGGKIRSFNILRHLARWNQVTLLSYYGGRRDESYETALRNVLPGALSIHTGAPDATPLEQRLDYLRHLFSSAPYAVAKFSSQAVQNILAERLSGHEFDVAVCDFLSASFDFPRELRTPTVLFQHNVESILWKRQAAHEPNLLKRVAYKLESFKMSRYERTTVRRFPRVIAVSEEDRAVMGAMTDRSLVSVVPTGVDLSQYHVAPAESSSQPLVVFTGSMDWEANVDAVDYFCREVWPQVLAIVPNARFRIVGRNPHPRVTKLASDSVEVTGSVPSVIYHLREAAVVVVPLRIGGGTRLKIFEAMAMGRAVVSTTIGAEGLDVHDGRDIVIADSAGSFADSIVRLLQDQTLRRRTEKAAADLAARYDWSVIAARFQEVLELTAGFDPATAEAPRRMAGGLR
jgi:glycosyltransferase involved in cell wall biosynthesis